MKQNQNERFFLKVSTKAGAKAQKQFQVAWAQRPRAVPPNCFLDFGSGFGIDFFENNGNGNGNGNFDRYIFARFSQNVPTHVLKAHVDFSETCTFVFATTFAQFPSLFRLPRLLRFPRQRSRTPNR